MQYSIFQVLISIQSLILCAEPYYNEPGFERMYGTTAGDSESHKYSEDVFKNNLKHAVLGQLSNPPEGFEDVVKSHFYLKRWVLLKVRCKRTLFRPILEHHKSQWNAPSHKLNMFRSLRSGVGTKISTYFLLQEILTFCRQRICMALLFHSPYTGHFIRTRTYVASFLF